MDSRKPLPRDLKVSPICPRCTGWREEVSVGDKKWIKCMSCGLMEILHETPCDFTNVTRGSDTK